MNVEIAKRDDIGGRDDQQDRVAVFARRDARLLVLADGMGGYEGGALAAQAVVDTAEEQFHSSTAGSPADLLTVIATGSHERINTIGAERGISPHSTCILLHLRADISTWAHVGDSRLYRFCNGHLVERTVDHSVVELLRLQGRITEEEMKTHPDQNRLYEALGGKKPPEIETGGKNASEGDGFLLASDGLWENASQTELEAVFEAANLDDALRRLIQEAKAKGGPKCDNLSVAAARYRRAMPTFRSRIRRSFFRSRGR